MTVTEKSGTAGRRRLPDEAFWEHSWPRLEAKLGRIVAKKLPSGAESSDVTQHVAAALARRPESFEAMDNLAAYATTVACNYVKQLYRARGRERDVAFVTAPAKPEDVEDSVIRRLRLECVAEFVSELDERDRFAFEDPRGEPERLEGAIRTRRSRLRRLLRIRLERKIGGAVVLPRLRWFLPPMAASSLFLPSVLPGPIPGLMPPPAAAGTAASVPRGLVARSDEARLSAVGTAGRAAPRASSLPEPPPSAGTGYDPLVEVRGPGGSGAGAGTRNPPRDAGPEPIICLSGTDPLEPVCVAHPLRS